MTWFWASFDSVELVLAWLWHVLGTGLVHGTVLAAVTAVLAATVLKRARPALLAALWSIVLIKFLVPVGPEVPVSLSGLVDGLLTPATTASGAAVATSGGTVPTEVSRSAAAVVWLAAQLLLWLVYPVLVTRSLLRHGRNRRAQRCQAEAYTAADAQLLTAARTAAARVKLKRLPLIRVSETVSSPYVVGLWRPVLVIPTWLTTRDAELRAALLHELAHLRRGDTWMHAVQVVAGTLFAFWPVVRWINRRIDETREMACDQWAISYGPLDTRAYARMLLGFARGARLAHAPAGAAQVGMMGARSQLESRVGALLAGAAKPRLDAVSGVAVGLWALVSLGGAQGAHAEHAAEECEIAPGIVAQLLQQYPEADSDRDGILTREEVCAHQKRMQRLLREDGTDAEHDDNAVSWLEPLADRDGDGAASELEIAAFKDEWNSVGLPNCADCNCADSRELSTSNALVTLDWKFCINEEAR